MFYLSNNYKYALLALLVTQIIYFGSVLFQGHVISPHNNAQELGLFDNQEMADHTSNRRFSDHSNQFIPEINQHINGSNYGWLSVWVPHTQFGRPSYQRWHSKANLLTHVLSFFTDNPLILFASLTVLIVGLTGLFCFLFLRSLHLHALACFAGAIGLSLGTFFTYWLTFPQFLALRCWTMGLLWLIIEFIRNRTWAAAAGIAFFTYNLFMMGRIQAVIRSTYFIVGFALLFLWLSNARNKDKFVTAIILFFVAFIGVIGTLPTYLDMAVNTARSARLEGVNDAFFLATMPTLNDINDLLLFANQLINPFWHGNPIESNYPLPFNGLSVTPVFYSLFILSFVYPLYKRIWPWQAFIVLCLVATLWEPAYLFMVHHMGFHLSRTRALGEALIPLFIVVAYSVDYILNHNVRITTWVVLILLLPVVLGTVVAYHQDKPLNFTYIALSVFLIAGTIYFLKTKNMSIFIILVVGSTLIYSSKLQLTRPLHSVHITSPLVKKIQTLTQNGARFSWIGSSGGVLPSNQEMLFDIKSIHSYDSISTKDYQALTLQLSENGASTYGRSFPAITSTAKLNNPAFSYTGIGLFLSRQEISHPSIRKIDEVNGIKLYTPQSSNTLQAQLLNFDVKDNNNIFLDGFLHQHKQLKIKRLISTNDHIAFRVTPTSQETLLFLSQQYHPYWAAHANGVPIPTVKINKFYLGIIIPTKTSNVELKFQPIVRWSWIPQLFFVILLLFILIAWIVNYYTPIMSYYRRKLPG